MFILLHIAGSRCEFSIVSGLRNVNLGLTSRSLCMRNQKGVIKRRKCRRRESVREEGGTCHNDKSGQ